MAIFQIEIDSRFGRRSVRLPSRNGLLAAGAVPMGFVPAAQSYFDVHHSGLDPLDKVHSRELEWGAILFTVMAVSASEEGI